MTLNRSFTGAAARTTLNGAITSGSPAAGGTFTLTSGTGYPTTNFVVSVFILNADGSHAGEEKIFCSTRSGNVCTVGTSGRAFDDTVAADHANGSVVEHCLDAASLTALVAHVNDVTTDVHSQYILKSLYDANTVLAATSDDTPAALTMGASTILARLAAGNIVAATPTQLRTLLALTIGTNVQAWDADLDAIAALTSAANKMPYATGAQAWSLADLTAAGRALLDDADASAQLTTLGVSTFIKTLLDDADAATAQATLGITGSSTVCVVKSADETVNNNGTPQADDELLAALAANTEYPFEAFIYWTQASATPDLVFNFTVPTGATIVFGVTVDKGSTLATDLFTATGSNCTAATSNTAGMWVRIIGSVRNGANAGNLQFNWSQAIAHGSDSKVKAGSWLRTQVGT